MKKFLFIALLAMFAGKVSFGQTLISENWVGGSHGPYQFTHGYSPGYAITESNGSLASGGFISLIYIKAVGYNNSVPTYLAEHELDYSEPGYFVDIVDYYLDFASYDYVEVTYECAYCWDGANYYDDILVCDYEYAP